MHRGYFLDAAMPAIWVCICVRACCWLWIWEIAISIAAEMIHLRRTKLVPRKR